MYVYSKTIIGLVSTFCSDITAFSILAIQYLATVHAVQCECDANYAHWAFI